MVSANLIWHFKEITEADGWFLMTNFFFTSTEDLLFDANCTELQCPCLVVLGYVAERENEEFIPMSFLKK